MLIEAGTFTLLALGAAIGLLLLGRSVLRSKRDLAGNREREKAGLAEHRQLMASLLEQTQEGFWFVDMASRTTEVNPAMCAMLGRVRDEVLGKDIFAFVDAQNAQIVRAQIEVGAQGKVGRYRLQLRRPDGTLLPCLVQASPTYDGQGALTGSIGLYTDISELEGSQQALAETRQLLELALDGSNLSIWDWRASQGGTFLDRRWRSILGFADAHESHVTLEELAQITHPDDLQAVREARLECMRGRTDGYNVEHRVRRADGGWVWINSTGKVVERDSAGLALRMTGTNRDISPRKQAEEALGRANLDLDRQVEQRTAQLREREQELWLFTEHIPAAVARYDASLFCRYTNSRYADEMGRSVDSMIGRPSSDWLGEQVVAEQKPLLQRVFAGETVRFERAHRGDPSRTMDVTLLPFIRAHGVQDGYFGFSVDNTERKRQQAALQLRESQLRAVIDLMPNLIFVRDRDGRFLIVNRAFAEFFGCESADLIGKTLEQIGLDKALAAAMAERDAMVRSSGKSLSSLPLPLVGRDGKVRMFSTVRIPYRHSDTHPDAVLGVTTDVTESQALRHSEERLRQVFDLAPLAITVKDAQGRFLMVNRATSISLYGLAAAELIGKTMAECGMDAQVADEVEQADMQARANHAAVDLTTERIGPDGRRRWGTSRRIPFRFSDQHPDALLTVTAEVTALKEAEEKVRQLNADLESTVRERTAALTEAVREIEAFSYSVSHDLRAPLRAVLGFSRLLQENHAAQLDADGRQLLDRVSAAGERMGAMIDGMLALGQLSRTRIKSVPLDLTAIARLTWDELVGAEPGRQVEFVLAHGLAAVGDPVLVRSLLQNLLGNAFKFTRHAAQARVEFSSAQVEGETVFVVRDNGAGFDMAYQQKLFGVFQRLHVAKEFEGTGIGLATVRRIAMRHAGRVWAEGKTGQGAQFYFTLAGPG